MKKLVLIVFALVSLQAKAQDNKEMLRKGEQKERIKNLKISHPNKSQN